jgi:flagellar basal body-associated protein FliL
MAATARRSSTRLIVVILVIVGLLALAAGIYYFTTTSGKLPTWFPGYLAGSTHHHIKRAIAGVGVAVLCAIGVWLLSGRRSQIGSA